MAIPKFEVDLNIISKLSDYPGTQDGLTPDGFRQRFDLAGKLIQEFINNTLIPNINISSDPESLIAAALTKLSPVVKNSLAQYFDSVLKSGDYVLNEGYNFAISKVSDTQFRVNGGKAIMQGHLIEIPGSQQNNIGVVVGSYGTIRKDLICLRFSRNDSGEESYSLVYLQGEPRQSGAADPAYRQDNINREGAVTRDFPLYRININGTTAEYEALFSPMDGMTTKANRSVSLWKNAWSNNVQTVSVAGVTADNDVFVSAAPASYTEYAECMIRCTAQGSGTLTFACEEVPVNDIGVNIIIFD